MNDIVEKTQLDEQTVLESISRLQKKSKPDQIITRQRSIETEVADMRKDITEIKNTLKELVAMMNALYVFEDA